MSFIIRKSLDNHLPVRPVYFLNENLTASCDSSPSPNASFPELIPSDEYKFCSRILLILDRPECPQTYNSCSDLNMTQRKRSERSPRDN